ncbi:Syntaxin pep12 [Frankliniella fusca]|uniref:Syntaxin pep12 n=1 Tax=Frankliniella fusca TaxID=407009 RepID=A0AAE1HBN6_9NEOP|nr:Syntaxin pep12 [Frankliniella fusca]
MSYLNRCWELESSTEKVEDDAFPSLTVLHICAAHAICRVRTYVKETGKPDHVRRLAEKAHRTLLRTDNLSDARKVLRLIAKVFGCAKQSPDVDTAVAELERIQREHVQRVARAKGRARRDVDELTPQEEPIAQRELERDVEEAFVGGNSLNQRSPYNTFSHGIIEEARREVQQVRPGTNEYFIDGFLHYLEVQHLAYLPLMTRTFVRKEVDDLSQLITNNPAEKWFDVVKNNLFKGSTNIRRAQVLRGLKQYVRGDLLLRAKYPLPREPRLHRRQPNKLRGLSSKGRGRGANRTWGTSRGRGRARKSRVAPVILQGELLPPTADPSIEVDTRGGYQEPSLASSSQDNNPDLLQTSSSSQIEPEANQALSSGDIRPETIQEDQNLISDLLIQSERDNKTLEARFKEIEQMKYKPQSEILTVEEVTADKEKRVEEIIKELNAPPQRMTAAKEERHRFRKLAEVLLNTIKTEGCFLWLEEIVSGKRICDRHKFFNGRLKIGSTGQGPFATFQDLVRRKLYEYVEKYIIPRIEPQSVDIWQGEKEKAIPPIIYDQLRSLQYMHGVLIPEDIKYGFNAVHKCSEEVAETLHIKTSDTIYFRHYR